QAPFRGYYVTDQVRQQWPKEINWRSLDPTSAAAWGAEYINRHEVDRQEMDKVRARVAARMAGRGAADTSSAASSAAKSATVVGTAIAKIGQFPSWRDMEKQMLAATKPAPQLKDGHRKIVDAIRAGHISPKAIQQAANYGE